jgi:hypothetical protein
MIKKARCNHERDQCQIVIDFAPKLSICGWGNPLGAHLKRASLPTESAISECGLRHFECSKQGIPDGNPQSEFYIWDVNSGSDRNHPAAACEL